MSRSRQVYRRLASSLVQPFAQLLAQRHASGGFPGLPQISTAQFVRHGTNYFVHESTRLRCPLSPVHRPDSSSPCDSRHLLEIADRKRSFFKVCRPRRHQPRLILGGAADANTKGAGRWRHRRSASLTAFGRLSKVHNGHSRLGANSTVTHVC